MKRLTMALLVLAAANSVLGGPAPSRSVTERTLSMLAAQQGNAVSIEMKLLEARQQIAEERTWNLSNEWQVATGGDLSQDDLNQILSAGAAKGQTDLLSVPRIVGAPGEWREVTVCVSDSGPKCRASVHFSSGPVTVAHTRGLQAKVRVSEINGGVISLEGIVSLLTGDADKPDHLLMPFQGAFPLNTNVVVFSSQYDDGGGKKKR